MAKGRIFLETEERRWTVGMMFQESYWYSLFVLLYLVHIRLAMSHDREIVGYPQSQPGPTSAFSSDLNLALSTSPGCSQFIS